jgi:hypothetical protein
MSKIDPEFIRGIKELYPSLKAWSDDHALELYEIIEEHQLIKEFNHTVDEEKTIEHVQRQIGSDVQ